MIIVFYCYFHGLNVPIIRCLGGWNLKRLRAQVLEALIHVVQVAVKTDASEERIEDNSSVRAIVDENPLHVVCMLHKYVWICCVYISTHITHTHIFIYTYTYKSHTHCTCLHIQIRIKCVFLCTSTSHFRPYSWHVRVRSHNARRRTTNAEWTLAPFGFGKVGKMTGSEWYRPH